MDTVHECDRQTDGQTDRQTELPSQRPCNAERRTVKTGARFGENLTHLFSDHTAIHQIKLAVSTMLSAAIKRQYSSK